MLLTIFPRDGGVYPEFHSGRLHEHFYVELDPTGASVEDGVRKRWAAAVLDSKKKSLPVAESVPYPIRPGFSRPYVPRAITTVRFKIPTPGTYTIRLFATEEMTLKVKARKASDTLYDVTLEAKHILRDSFLGTVKLNGVRLTFNPEPPAERRTVWEHLEDDVG
jgi:hypothetical protein